MQRSSYVILSYKVKHNYDVSDFLDSYRYLLQKAIDVIWGKIEWKRKGKRSIPQIPKSRKFKRELRNCLLQNWSYASHYVDSAIKTAYSILSSWRRNYLKGRRGRNKPVVKRRFVRIKETLYRFRDWRINVTVKPRQLYLDFDLSNAWFRRRVEGYELGELILKEGELTITFRKPLKRKGVTEYIGWDLNKYSLDGYSPKYGWIRVDLRKLYHIHRVHEVKRRSAQSVASKKPSLKPIVSKHGSRERNRARDFIHKLTTELARMFPNAVHGFEDLNKQGMFTKNRKHNRDIAKQNWKTITQYISYKSSVILVNPRYTSSTCPMCGGRLLKLRKGRLVKCPKCGLALDRQLCGAINIYLKMRGFPPSPSTFHRVMIKKMIPRLKVQMRRGRGVALKGCETNDMFLMNLREPRLMCTKAYVGLPKLRKLNPLKI